MWDLPWWGLEPVSPALAGRFSTTVPPGKPKPCIFYTLNTCTKCHWNVHFKVVNFILMWISPKKKTKNKTVAELDQPPTELPRTEFLWECGSRIAGAKWSRRPLGRQTRAGWHLVSSGLVLQPLVGAAVVLHWGYSLHFLDDLVTVSYVY